MPRLAPCPGQGDGRTTWEYDALNRKIREVRPLGRATEWARDAAGRVARERRPSGRTVVNAHSPSGLLLSARFWAPGAAAPAEVVAEHDACGRVVWARDGEGESAYAYDPCGRPTRETRAGAGRAEYAVSTFWNRAGLRTRVVDPGKTVNYTYDHAGRLRSAGEEGRATVYAHDRRGDKVGERSAAGLEQRWERDALGRCVLHAVRAARRDGATRRGGPRGLPRRAALRPHWQKNQDDRNPDAARGRGVGAGDRVRL